MRWLILALFVLLVGCIRPPDPVWTEIPTAQQLLDGLTTDSKRYLTLDGVASVALTSGEKFFASQQFILLQKPDRLRADVLTGFGQLVLQIASDGESLSVFLNTTVPARFLRGSASYENIYRFIKVPLAIEDLLTLLLYEPPLIAYQHSRVTVAGKNLILTLLGSNNNRQELLFDQQLRVVGCRYFAAGKKYLAVDYQKFSKENQFPQVILIAMPLDQTRVKVKFSDLKVNANIDLARFSLKEHMNIPIEELPD